MLHARLFDLTPEEGEKRVAELIEKFELETVADTLAESHPARHPPAPVARRRRAARARGADPRRADLGRRSGRARRLLGADDQPVARGGRDDLPVDPFHERGGALRPHVDDAPRQGARPGAARRAGRASAGRPISRPRSSAIWRTSSRRTPRRRPKRCEPPPAAEVESHAGDKAGRFSFSRVWAFARREAIELRHDSVRLAFAVFGPLLLMVVFGYGISLDVENLTYAVLDYDNTCGEPRLCRRLSRLDLLRRARTADERRRARPAAPKRRAALRARNPARLRARAAPGAPARSLRLFRRRRPVPGRNGARLCRRDA